MRRFTLLRVDLSKENDDPALGEIREVRRRDAARRPRRLARRQDPRQDVDGELPPADRFRDKLVAALPR